MSPATLRAFSFDFFGSFVFKVEIFRTFSGELTGDEARTGVDSRVARPVSPGPGKETPRTVCGDGNESESNSESDEEEEVGGGRRGAII